MEAMTSRFNIRCVIQYYSDQWSTHSMSIISMFLALIFKNKRARASLPAHHTWISARVSPPVF